MSRLREIACCGIIFLVECWFSSSCSDTGTSSSITVNITCDSYLDLYVDGKHLGGGATNVITRGYLVYQIMAGSHVVALHCKASNPPWKGGILGSFENGLVTDTSWKCVTSAKHGWNMKTYRDDDWPIAKSYGANDDKTLPWGEIGNIDSKADWIWSEDNENDTEVYCRHTLVEPCTEVKQSYFQRPETGQDIAITGFKLLEIKVTSVTGCGLKCGQYSACVSFTVQYSDSPGSRLCELYSVTAAGHPHSVIRKEGFQYYEVAHVFH